VQGKKGHIAKEGLYTRHPVLTSFHRPGTGLIGTSFTLGAEPYEIKPNNKIDGCYHRASLLLKD